jgi:hypothetical protein
MLVSVWIFWTLYGSIATFYPPYKNKHHKTLKDSQVGVVLSMYEAGFLVSSPIIIFFLTKYGKKTIQMFGNTLIISASLGFGLLVYI